MRQAIKDSRFSREQICDRMNERAKTEGLSGGRGNRITVAALDGWVAETKVNQIPVNLLPLFCWATESVLPLKILASCIDADVIDRKDAKILALAKVEIEAQRIARKRKRLKQEIEDVLYE
jgi:hypothetical protein